MNQSLINQFAKIIPQVDSNGKIYSENPNNYDNRDDSDKPNDRLLKPGEIGIHVNEDKSKSELLMNVGTKDKPNIIRISNAIDTAQLSRITNHTLEQDFSIINKDGTTVFEVDEKDKTKGKLLRLTVICDDAVNSTDVLDIFTSSSTVKPWLSVSLTENSGHIFAVQGNLENLILKIKDNSGTYVDRTDVNISILLEYFMERQAVLSSIDTSGKPIKVIDSLDSNSATDVLSANMGKVLNDKITNLDNNKADLNKDNFFTSNNSFNNPVIVAEPTAEGHAATKKYVDSNIKSIKENISTDFTNYSKLDADNTFRGSNTFENPVIVAEPTAEGHAATKKYVDSKKATISVIDSITSNSKIDALSANMGNYLYKTKVDQSKTASNDSYATLFSRAGCKAYKVTDINYTAKTYTLTTTLGLSVGKWLYPCRKETASIYMNGTAIQIISIDTSSNTIEVSTCIDLNHTTHLIPKFDHFDKDNYGTEICGSYAHAEGTDCSAFGNQSHAEGNSSIASGNYAHAEGYGTFAGDTSAHAEGYGTFATGYASHAEGNSSHASSFYAHAEGYYTAANGWASHAEGSKTVANSEKQHVQGMYNIPDNANKYAHIVGNGNDTKNSNAHTLDWEGNSWYQGNIKIGGTSYDDTNAQYLATQNYIINNSIRVAYISDNIIKSSTYSLSKYFNVANYDMYIRAPFVYPDTTDPILKKIYKFNNTLSDSISFLVMAKKRSTSANWSSATTSDQFAKITITNTGSLITDNNDNLKTVLSNIGGFEIIFIPNFGTSNTQFINF